MKKSIRNLKGSESRDVFKRHHKDLSQALYACDLDFVLLAKEPVPDIVAAIDYKSDDDEIRFSEVIAYNALVRRGIQVFIVQGDPETGAFQISRYEGGHHRKPRYTTTAVATTKNWNEFEAWEFALRHQFGERYGDY